MAVEPLKKSQINLSQSEWFSTSDSWWEISGANDSFRSRLEYDKNDAKITVIGGRLNLSNRFSINLSYGSGKMIKGKVTDSDWFTSQAQGLNNDKLIESKEDGIGTTSIFEFGGRFRFTKQKNHNKQYIYIGYFSYRDNIRIINGTQTLADDRFCTLFGIAAGCLGNAGDPIPGLNSTFDFEWEFLKIGIDGEVNKNNLGLEVDIYYLHLLNYTGKGFWNLRPLKFTLKSNEGSGLETNVAGTYRLSKSAKIKTGYRYFMLTAKNGTDRTYDLSGKLIGVADLDTVEAKRHGPYISLEVNF